MEPLKKVYAGILIVLPVLLVGMIQLVGNERIVVYTTNYEVVAAESAQVDKAMTIEVYGEGFRKGDSVYIEGEKQETEVVYDKMLTFQLPKKYLKDKKIRIKVQRISQAGIAKESSNAYHIEVGK
ncbi:MAG: hypothetical protein ACRDDX_13835 [Cellulosilyticaceae bacterium]